MFFLLRATFWIGLVLVLIPSDGPKSVEGPKTGDALLAATAALSDATRFCERQPEACTVGSQAASYLGQRAQAGAKRLYGIVSEKAEARADTPRPATISSQNTLTASDRDIPFRAPHSKASAS